MKKEVQVTFKVDEALMQEMRELAKRNARSVSAEVRLAVEARMEKEKTNER